MELMDTFLLIKNAVAKSRENSWSRKKGKFDEHIFGVCTKRRKSAIVLNV